jgi:ubiquinone/menaquinone biosynthesis C-methylase UbiE
MNLIDKFNPLRILEKIQMDFFWRYNLQKNPFLNAYRRVLKLKTDDTLLQNVGIQQERALPSDVVFQRNGWWKKMILRYGIAADLSENKLVLDTCSGIGWGAFLVSQNAKKILGIDIDESSVKFAQDYWGKENLNFEIGSVLDMDFEDNSFDVVLAMESIEHFNLEDGKKYISECYRVLKKGGVLFGSSAFPKTRNEADMLCSKNPYHFYVYTKKEIKYYLNRHFSKVYLYRNRLFFKAIK